MTQIVSPKKVNVTSIAEKNSVFVCTYSESQSQSLCRADSCRILSVCAHLHRLQCLFKSYSKCLAFESMEMCTHTKSRTTTVNAILFTCIQSLY